MNGWAVVLFQNNVPDEFRYCTLDRCPIGTAEWFATHEEAEKYANTLPEGFEPHFISIRSKDE